MKKKAWLGLAAFILVLAMGTTAFALESNGTFEQMQPQMKQMHPEYSDEQLQDMYQSCHSDKNTQMMNQSSMKNMMNNPA